MNSCFVHPCFTSLLSRLASAQMSTGVEISLKPKVSFKIESGVQVTIFHVAAAVALEGPVFQRQPVVQRAAVQTQLA